MIDGTSFKLSHKKYLSIFRIVLFKVTDDEFNWLIGSLLRDLSESLEDQGSNSLIEVLPGAKGLHIKLLCHGSCGAKSGGLAQSALGLGLRMTHG